MTEDKPLCMDFHAVGFIPAFFSRTKNSDGDRHRSFHVLARRTSAAALSAAVDSTKQQETAPTSQAEPPMQKRTSQTPAALRERGSGGEALLSEKRPLPQNLHTVESLREGARGRGLLYREAPSLAKPLRSHFFREPGFFDAALQPVAAEVVDDEEQGRDRPCDGIAEEHEVNVVMTRRDKLHPNDAQ